MRGRKRGMKGKACACVALTLMILAAAGLGSAEGGQIVVLPDETHTVLIPQDMTYQAPGPDETDLRAIYLMEPDLEMLIFAYEAGDMTLQELAEVLTAAGRTAEIRTIGDTEFIVFQDRDEADGAPCVGYSYLSGDRMIEISFFYSSQAAMDLTEIIMESFR